MGRNDLDLPRGAHLLRAPTASAALLPFAFQKEGPLHCRLLSRQGAAFTTNPLPGSESRPNRCAIRSRGLVRMPIPSLLALRLTEHCQATDAV